MPLFYSGGRAGGRQECCNPMSVSLNLKQLSQIWIDLFGSRIYKHVLAIPVKAIMNVGKKILGQHGYRIN